MGSLRTRHTWRATMGVAATTALALALAACGDDAPAEPAVTDATADETSGTGDDTEAGAEDEDEPEAASGDVTVRVATHPELGDILVDADGMTLYGFALDDGTTTACTGGCVDVWPPLVDADPVAGDGVDADALGTAEGIEPDQVTYDGQLLYYYAGDSEPGDATGVEIPDWYAVAPDGSPVEATAQGSSGSGGPYDY